MQIDYLSTCIGVIAGAIPAFFSGIAIEYFGSILTDRRQEKEKQKAKDEEFSKVATLIPELLQEIKQDITKYPCRREFFVLLEGVSIAIYKTPTLQYEEEVHSELNGKIGILENHGYIIDITPSTVPMYKMTEQFVDYLLKSDLPVISTTSAEASEQ